MLSFCMGELRMSYTSSFFLPPAGELVEELAVETSFPGNKKKRESMDPEFHHNEKLGWFKKLLSLFNQQVAKHTSGM